MKIVKIPKPPILGGKKREDILEINTQTRFILQFNIIIKMVLYSFKIKFLFLRVICYKYGGVICSTSWVYLKPILCNMALSKPFMSLSFN